ncbi:MAG: hydrogenase expression/formation protein HypE [Actinomycetota bacterium]|nr:hydrogenase expression/formation protein HypE [Actinomycetota bacterium]
MTDTDAADPGPSGTDPSPSGTSPSRSGTKAGLRDSRGNGADSEARETAVLERIERFRRRRSRLRDTIVTLAHGAGGKSSAALIDEVFRPVFADLDESGAVVDMPLNDGALMELPSGERLAFSTDSFVVKPLRFPGGSIGDLAVNGTVNDLAMMGARPAWLSAAFVLEEGFAIDDLRVIAADMGTAAGKAGVRVVTGDTKVVNRGAADGLYVTTAGVGVVPAGRTLSPDRVRPGDVVLVSGTIADHGMAVMLARGDLAIESDIHSDTAPLGELVELLFSAAPGTRWLRDPTRGGVGTVCNELARDAGVAVILDEARLPIDPAVGGACDMLGIDPLYVANEGKFVAIVGPEEEEAALAALRSHPFGQGATRIGQINEDPPGIVVLLTSFGGTRIVDMLVGDPLPRIC